MLLPFHSYSQPSRVPARVVNLYAQATLSNKSPVELISAPGIVSFAELDGPGRGLFVHRGSLYAVGGSVFYKIAKSGAVSRLGEISGANRLTFASNGADEIVTSNKYRWDGAVLSQIDDADMPQITAVDSIDNYIVYVQKGTGFFGCSELNDAGNYSALDFSDVDGMPDDLVTLIVDHRQVILFGEQSTEIWYNSAAASFPFERLPGGFLEVGALAVHGVCKADNSVFWLANDRTIRRLSGMVPQRVSQHGVEEALAGYANVTDCVAFPYAWQGHTFVVFRFPSAGACWTLDLSTNEWHERSTYGESDWLVVGSAACYGRVFVQHSVTGDVGYLSDEVYTEWGGILRREWVYPQVWASGEYAFHADFELVCRTGDAPINVTPYVHLEVSNDGGNTWWEVPRRELGNVGEYGQRIRWARLGRSRDRVYRASVSDPVPLRVLATEVTVG